MARPIGVALSGGGHRASVWGTGVLAAVVDAGLGGDVVSVSSVSGGSITNGVVAQNLDLRTATSDEFDAAVRDSLVNYARVGLFPAGPLTKRYLRLVIATLIVAVVLVVVLLAAFVAAAASWISGATAAVVLGALGVVTVIAWAGAAVLVARRGTVVRSALARTHFGGDRRSLGTRLDEVARDVNHVFLTTDLEAGDQFYLAPRFLYGFREGIADPAATGTSIAAAVQASAGLPGAFPPVILETGPFRRPWDVPGDVPAELPRRVILPVPVLTPRLSSAWISLVTPVTAKIARPLAEGLRNRTVCRDDSAQQLMPGPLFAVKDAIDAALGKLEQGQEVFPRGAGKQQPSSVFGDERDGFGFGRESSKDHSLLNKLTIASQGRNPPDCRHRAFFPGSGHQDALSVWVPTQVLARSDFAQVSQLT